jgi:hypothetical protein
LFPRTLVPAAPALPTHSHCVSATNITTLQVQLYVHGMVLNPAERRFRLTAALSMEAAALMLLAAEYCK